MRRERALKVVLVVVGLLTAWSSFAHAAVMGTQALLHWIQSEELWGVGALIIIGILLIVLAPVKTPAPTSPSS